MTQHSSATRSGSGLLSRAGLLWGLVGVTAFSLTVPLTRVAVAGGLPPLFVGCGRAVVAAALAAVALVATGQRLPQGRQWIRLAVIAGGVVVGFPVLTSYALTTASAGHSAVVIAVLPAATAVIAVLREQQSVRPRFWFVAAMGAAVAIGFAAVRGGQVTGLQWSDLLLLGAVVAAAVGYAEGGLLSRELGAWQTVSWALVVSAPVTGALAAFSWWRQPSTAGASEWAAFAYLAVVSMYLGFFAWYRGLAIGPMSSVSQIQLVQPVLTICWAAIILHEGLTWPVVGGGAAVIACATVAVRTRMSPTVRQEEFSK
ncbi:EamA family transporter [Rhodococcus sp. 06-235-1A]|uniref:DMT family transporter n=1 Tax=Rhodococcus sp. 06-235-1A TaxID=2022508 RepID=UPI000B9BFC83|nr:DMT family transporter [Rhodococcus sp. 06-235-1A]OZD07177.1 EamA family transporter [Rhodococcus sp. 06-235-1A]